MAEVTTHDITANGKNYILEWTHSDDRDGWIAITEACTTDHDEEENVDEQLETYDFKEVE